jgi:hypothetical protein
MFFHFHKWDVISAACDGHDHYFNGYQSGFFLATHIVLRCSQCGKIKGQTIRGNHPLKTRDEHPEVTRALEDLERKQ